MNENETKAMQWKRDLAVDMSSEAISSRLREVGDLNQLGLSLAKAKPCEAPNQLPAPKSTERGSSSDKQVD